MMEERGASVNDLGSNTIGRQSIGERLSLEAQLLRSRLLDIEAALKALQSNPEVEQIINLISKVEYRF